MIAKGAPGSGKTLVAAELADVAASLCDYDVLLLVPTLRLREHYEQWVGTSAAADRVSIELVQDYFQDCAGNKPGELSRLSRLRAWWEDALARPAFNAWSRQHPLVRSARFLALLDATLASDVDGQLNAKDALDTADAELYARCRDIQTRKAWRDELGALQVEHELTLRCQAAQSLEPATVSSGTKPLLVIVDECQDLAPAEWQALLHLVNVRCRADRGTRIALLGDEAQRISPTSFAWAEVARHAVDQLGWDATAVQEVVLPGSYRVPHRIGAVSVSVFRAPVADLGKSRHVELLDPALLPAGGELTVVVHDGAGDQLHELDDTFRAIASGGTLPVVMVDAESLPGPRGLSTNVERLPIELAKGLEFGAIIVNPPLARPLPLSFDRAAAFYTALTRTIHRAICLVPEARWSELREMGFGDDCTCLRLTEPDDRQRAIDLILQFAEATTTVELAEVLKARVRGTLDEYRLSTSTEARATLLREAVQDFGRLLHLGEVEYLGVTTARAVADLQELPEKFAGMGLHSAEERAGVDLVLGRYGALSGAYGSDGCSPHIWARSVATLAETEMSDLERSARHLDSVDVPVPETMASLILVELGREGEGLETPVQSDTPCRTIHEASLTAQLDALIAELAAQLDTLDSVVVTDKLTERLTLVRQEMEALGARVGRLASEAGIAA